jgi:predicted dehydrogenase
VKSAHGYRPGDGAGVDRSMLISFEYREGAVGSLYYSWEVPSPMKGIRMSRIYGREGTISFESNGAFLFAQGRSLSMSIAPGLSDAGGFKGMFRDFLAAIAEDREPAFTLEMARSDLNLIERIQRQALERGETRAA